MPVFVEFFICIKSHVNSVKIKRVSTLCGLTLLFILCGDGAKQRLVYGAETFSSHFNSEETLKVSKNSVNYRIEYLENGVIDFLSSPLFGIGRTGAIESINQVVQFYGRERFSHHHNELISTLCMRGLFGLFFFILYFYLIIKLIKDEPSLQDNQHTKLLLVVIISQITFFIFDSPFIGSMKSVDFFVITFFLLYAQFIKRKIYLNEQLHNNHTHI
jgi:O-antigen ligase